MKKITLTLVLITIAIAVIAQTPQAFKYQAVARDNAGNVLVNQNVTFRFSILQGSAGGTVIFQETHEAITNEFGLVNLEIGNGEPETGFLSEIDWSTGEKFLEVELDTEGGYTFISMGTTQLLAVPYALYSEATGDTTRWKKNNDDLYYVNGNVGIGTDSPGSWAKLDIKGNLSVDGNAFIYHYDATESILDFYNSISDWEIVGASDANRFDIRKWGGVPALSISDNNYIGIGTTTPAVNLDIRSSSTALSSKILLGNSDNSTNLFLSSGHESANPYISFKGMNALRFIRYDGGLIELMRIQSDGNVGIGTTIPTEMLEVADTIYSSVGGFKFPDGTVQETAAGTGGIISINDLTDGRTGGNSVFLGLWSGPFDDGTNNRNVAVGINALFANTSGEMNTATGHQALMSNLSGWNNTATGHQALFSGTSAAYNTATGYQALYLNTGNLNTATGYQAMYYNTTGQFNTAHGCQANYSNQGGSRNTIIGYEAGSGTIGHTKSGNVFLGYQAGYNDTTDNKLYIENSNSSSPLIYGEFENDIIRFNAKRVEIRNPGQNIFIGDSTGVMNTGSRNMFIGDKAGYSNTSGSDNIFIGDSTGFSLTTGNYNLFMGNWAGQLSTTGNSNVILGIAAGQANLEGYRNVMVGTTAGWSNTSGYENTFLGTSAGGYNTTGSCNTYIGRRAGLDNQEGDSSVFIGYYAGASETTSHKLYIENSDSSTPLIYGEFDNDILAFNAKVGIGTMDPGAKLEVRGNVPDDGPIFKIGNSDGSHRLTFFPGRENDPNPFIQWKEGDPLRFSTDEGGWSEKMRITSDGKVGIGTSDPLAGLHVEDTNGVLFTGIFGEGETPIEGAGMRMMWYPAKAAFRAGYVSATQWNDGMIGNYSIAMGNNTRASGDYSTAMGHATIADDYNSTAMGVGTYAGGFASTAMGSGTWATGYNSTAMGQEIRAQGSYTFAIALSDQNHLSVTQSNTMAIMGGKVGIGTITPTEMLEVADTIYSSVGGFKFPDGSVQTTAAVGSGASSIDDLSDAITGGYSVFLGSGAGANDDASDNGNAAVGIGALNRNTTGNHNTANGYNAQYWNNVGNGNVSIGYQADYYNEGGSQNTIIGYQAGAAGGPGLHDKSGNVFLGYQAGFYETGDNILCIENSSSSSPLIYGEFDNNMLAFNGNVGIGTTAPSTNLVVKSSGYAHGMIVLANDDDLIFKVRQMSGGGGGIYLYDESENSTILLNGEGDCWINSGRFGIGTGTPLAPLHVEDRIRVGEDPSYSAVYGELIHEGGGTGFKINANAGGGWADIHLQTDGSTKMFIESGGNVGIGTISPESRLDVQGNVTIRDISTGEIAIELGKGLDYAEGFNVTDETNIEPGTILCIDPENPGRLKISENPYDKTVAGIVAGANGLGSGVRLGSQEFDCDVALAGRVYCNTIATTENIEPGDLLTTSSIPGFAMKVTDFENAHGAILGKAMESLEKGKKGQILVLVTLH